MLEKWWKKGRLGSRYYKFKIIENTFVLPFDVYILKFPSGSHIKQHTDRVEKGDSRAHYRLNIILKHAKEGGDFKICGDCPCSYKFGPFELFRPDVCKHSQTQVKAGCKYYLSIGWLWGSK